MKCLNCGKDTGRNKYYCCQKCRVEHIRNKKKCEVCGKYFYVSPSSEKKTCSKECAHILKSNDGKFGAAKNNVKLAQIAATTSPNSGSFETNAIAKSWKIQSPNGTIYDKYLAGHLGGSQQLGAQIEHNEIDLVIFLRDPLKPKSHEPDVNSIVRLCDEHNIPLATNLATAELLIKSLDRGDLDWREMYK